MNMRTRMHACDVFVTCVLTSLLVEPALGRAPAKPEAPFHLRSPTLGETKIAFIYADDLWTVPRAGGIAHRLVTGGINSGPIFSHDGTQIAFTREVDRTTDVYVVPASGGTPRRLTSHPGPEVAVGWTPDGKAVLFRSPRMSHAWFDRLFTVPVQGGFASALQLPTGHEGSFSPDGAHLAYIPNSRLAFKQLRGGGTSPIWVANLGDSSIAAMPRDNSNDFSPMWAGNVIYFLSDRSGPVTLFSFDTASGQVKKLIENKGYDFKNAQIGPQGIAYEQFGSLHVYDLATHQSREVQVRLTGDFPQLQPHFEQIVSARISSLSISPGGARALLGAHGEVFTISAGTGEVRTIRAQTGVAQRDPVWSPDGQRIAYFSDDNGEYALKVAAASGQGSVRTINLGPSPTFFYHPTWAPDSKKIVYSDKHPSLWYMDLDHPTPVKVDTDRFDTPMAQFDAGWSPDSRWITYTKQLPNHLHAVFLYSLEKAHAVQATDGVCDVRSPAFDRDGDNLYLTCGADGSPMLDRFDVASYGQRIARNVYRMILRKDSRWS